MKHTVIAFAAIAIENERDEDLGDGSPPQAPGGFLTILDLTGSPKTWRARSVNLNGVADKFPNDPEPEYVDINEDNVAVVTLQENNHIVLVDLPTGRILNDWRAGSADLDQIDTIENNLIELNSSLPDIPREPDGATWLNTEILWPPPMRGTWMEAAEALPCSTRMGRFCLPQATRLNMRWFTWDIIPKFGLQARAMNLKMSNLVVMAMMTVVERDNQAGPDATIKRIYRFSISGLTPTGNPSGFPVVSKRLVRDLIPDLQATGGLVVEKIESLTVLPDGSALIVNDNDGLDDNNGETQLLRLPNLL
ncbi:MAG: esterase-like activity of phytase family protein [Leptolyngbyaceae cyanobacterium MO_188.B28]|nr:esterase-like activity of phytase family protein [Leptolyngbyaceae cyanobacterium MO_188.B28]